MHKKFEKLIILAQLLDLLLTMVAIEYLGFTEMNPLFSKSGILEIALFKMLAIAFLIPFMRLLNKVVSEKLLLTGYKIAFYVSISPVFWGLLNVVVDFVYA